MPSNKLNDYTKAEILQGIEDARKQRAMKLKRCLHCHKEFKVHRKDKVFCSDVCKATHWLDAKMSTLAQLKTANEELIRDNELLEEENKYLRLLLEKYK